MWDGKIWIGVSCYVAIAKKHTLRRGNSDFSSILLVFIIYLNHSLAHQFINILFCILLYLTSFFLYQTFGYPTTESISP
jgi:hypothetical protein